MLTSSSSSSYSLLRMLNNQRENIADVMLSISFTFNCMLSIHKAYIHNNYAFASAIMHLYITAMFVSFPRLTREPSPKKTFLKFTISFLTSWILFVFIRDFVLSLVVLFVIVGVNECLGLFCLYFFIEDKPLPVRKKMMKKKV